MRAIHSSNKGSEHTFQMINLKWNFSMMNSAELRFDANRMGFCNFGRLVELEMMIAYENRWLENAQSGRIIRIWKVNDGLRVHAQSSQ